MFAVKINEPKFEYDIHSIVKAFYPEENVKVLTPETAEDKKAELSKDVRMTVELTEAGAELVLEDTKYNWHIASDRPEATDKKAYKDTFKRFLYTSLSEQTGKKLPWGNLTGIRPTKIAYAMLEEGKQDAEILEFLEDLGGETGEGDDGFEPENTTVAGRKQSTNSSTQFVQTPTYTDISFDDMFREKVGGELDDFLVEIRTSLPYVSSAISNAHSVPDIYTDNSTTSTVYEPHIEVTITGSRDMSDMDARQFGEQIADVTLDKLYEAFERKGIGTSVNSRTK